MIELNKLFHLYVLNEKNIVLFQDNFMINNYLCPNFHVIEQQGINHVPLDSLSLFNYSYLKKGNTLTII